MNISLIASIDDSTCRIRWKIIPLLLDSMEKTNCSDYTFRKSVLARFNDCGRDHYPYYNHLIMSIRFDPKTCDMPITYCSGSAGDCTKCSYNPLTGFLDPQFSESTFIITRRETIDALLDAVELLAKTNKTALLRDSLDAESVFD